MLKDIENCIYYTTCVQSALFKGVVRRCPCYLIGATKIDPQIKKSMQSGKEDQETDDKPNVSSYSMYFEMLVCLNAGGNNDDLAKILIGR